MIRMIARARKRGSTLRLYCFESRHRVMSDWKRL